MRSGQPDTHSSSPTTFNRALVPCSAKLPRNRPHTQLFARGTPDLSRMEENLAEKCDPVSRIRIRPLLLLSTGLLFPAQLNFREIALTPNSLRAGRPICREWRRI